MGQTGIPVDTEHTVLRDYSFPVWLGSPVMALVCPVWLGGTVDSGWLHCSCGWSADELGHLPGGFLWGLWNLFMHPTA